jgi:hypothetical protein
VTSVVLGLPNKLAGIHTAVVGMAQAPFTGEHLYEIIANDSCSQVVEGRHPMPRHAPPQLSAVRVDG